MGFAGSFGHCMWSCGRREDDGVEDGAVERVKIDTVVGQVCEQKAEASSGLWTSWICRVIPWSEPV